MLLDIQVHRTRGARVITSYGIEVVAKVDVFSKILILKDGLEEFFLVLTELTKEFLDVVFLFLEGLELITHIVTELRTLSKLLLLLLFRRCIVPHRGGILLI